METLAVEHQLTDKGWCAGLHHGGGGAAWDSYSAAEHAVWRACSSASARSLKGRAREFPENQERFGMSAHAIPRFDELNLRPRHRLGAGGRGGLLPELTRCSSTSPILGDLVDPQARAA